MHIPDGFLSPGVTISTAVVSAGTLAISVKRVNQNIVASRIPLMGVLASFVFLVQLFSFPVGPGTSVHLSGALLIAILLGPLSGFIIMSVSLIAMALLFQHGGIFSLGANIFNLAGMGCFLGYALYRVIPGERLSIVLAGLFSTMAAAASMTLELYFSSMLDLSLGLKSIITIYTITGLIEGLITLMIILYVKRVKPEILGSTA